MAHAIYCNDYIAITCSTGEVLSRSTIRYWYYGCSIACTMLDTPCFSDMHRTRVYHAMKVYSAPKNRRNMSWSVH